MMFQSGHDRFDRFTERARRVLSLAQEEAQIMRQYTIGGEFILLGLLHEDEGVGARVLHNLGIEINMVRTLVTKRSERLAGEQLGKMDLRADSKKIIELALDEARRLNHHYIGTEHILLGLVRQDGVAMKMLEELGVAGEHIRTQLIQILSRQQRVQREGETFNPLLNWTKAAREKLTSGQAAEGSSDFMWHSNKPPEDDRNRFDRFDKQARKVLSLAQEEAQRFQHNYIGTEHLLLGLVRGGDNTRAGQALYSLGVDLNKVRNSVEFIIGRGDRIVLGEIGLTPRAKKVIELAVDEARRLQHDHVGTEHLLLGLVREGEGIAAGVLTNLGVDIESVRNAMLNIVGTSSVTPITPAMRFAGAYVRGEKGLEPGVSSIQDADDLVPELASPDDRGNRFTLRSRRVLIHAREEAQAYQCANVGTDHLLLALIREENGLAYHVLHNLHIERERIEKATRFLITEEHLREPGEHDGFTDDGYKALELAIEESHLLGQTTIGTEHLLLGLLHCEGMASGILITRSLTLEKARAEIRRLLGL